MDSQQKSSCKNPPWTNSNVCGSHMKTYHNTYAKSDFEQDSRHGI